MIKKTIFLLIFAIFAIPAFSFAASGTIYEGTLEMGDISSAATGVEVSLSPSVKAVYIQPTAAANASQAQWYAIGAGHPGGTTVYGTAQNITNIWKQSISNATELDTALGTIPETQASESEWETNWTK